jgi:hypothetical protein
LEAIKEAVQIRHELVSAHPDAFTRSLANSLNYLAFQLEGLGQPKAALAARQEAEQLLSQFHSNN